MDLDPLLLELLDPAPVVVGLRHLVHVAEHLLVHRLEPREHRPAVGLLHQPGGLLVRVLGAEERVPLEVVLGEHLEQLLEAAQGHVERVVGEHQRAHRAQGLELAQLPVDRFDRHEGERPLVHRVLAEGAREGAAPGGAHVNHVVEVVLLRQLAPAHVVLIHAEAGLGIGRRLVDAAPLDHVGAGDGRRLQEGLARSPPQDLDQRALSLGADHVGIRSVAAQEVEKGVPRQVVAVADQHQAAEHDHGIGPAAAHLLDRLGHEVRLGAVEEQGRGKQHEAGVVFRGQLLDPLAVRGVDHAHVEALPAEQAEVVAAREERDAERVEARVLDRAAVLDPAQETAEVVEPAVDDQVHLVLHPHLVGERGEDAAAARQAGHLVIQAGVVVPAVHVRVERDEQGVDPLAHAVPFRRRWASIRPRVPSGSSSTQRWPTTGT
jgi:hypothetical protein